MQGNVITATVARAGYRWRWPTVTRVSSLVASELYQLEKTVLDRDRGQTDRFTALPSSYALDSA